MGGGHSASHCFDSSGFASLSSSFSISPPDQVVVTRYSEPKSRARVDLLIIKSLKRGKRESDLLINNLNNHRPLPFTVAAPPVPIAWRENLENFLSILSSLLSFPFFLLLDGLHDKLPLYSSQLFIALHNFRFLRDKWNRDYLSSTLLRLSQGGLPRPFVAGESD